jgi:low affinity Fe/Cu permease
VAPALQQREPTGPARADASGRRARAVWTGRARGIEFAGPESHHRKETSVPRRRKSLPLARFLETLSVRVTEWAGSSTAFGIAVIVILVWAVTGPVFHYSNTWQLVINTGTTIVTFLMVFLIQRAQNKDSRAAQLKLNEIVAALEGASNRLINVEDLSEEEILVLRRHYAEIAKICRNRSNLLESHSIEEARERDERKAKKRKTA